MTGSKATTAPYPSRWDPDWIERRRIREAGKTGFSGDRSRPALPFHYRVLRGFLRGAGLYERGFRNYLRIGLREEHHRIPGWPRQLDGYRMLQLSDLHLDLDPAFLPRLCDRVTGLESELVAFTGDFWEAPQCDWEQTMAGMERLLQVLPAPADGCYGVLGNHDACSLGAQLESLGIRILVNEAVVIGDGPGSFALAGVDDPFYFQLHDIEAAAAHCPGELPRLLLSHSPQDLELAERAGFSFMLCGHTHGGQVCWPNGWPLVGITGIPRTFFRGPWQYGKMRGYTSNGAGACHVPVRFNCPAEVVRHHLHAAD